MAKQYVNLPQNATKRHGNKVVYKVRTTVSDSDKTPAPGRPVVWVLEKDPGNTDEKYLSDTQRARLQHTSSTSDSQAWAHNTLYLPHVGGDKYKVKVYRQGDPPTSAVVVDEIETWRKIFYTCHYVGHDMRQLFLRIKGRMISGLAAGFVELVENAVVPTPNIADDAVATSLDLRTLYENSYPLDDKPWHVRIVVARNLVDGKTENMQVLAEHNTNDATCVMGKSGDGFKAVVTTTEDLLGSDPVNSVYATPYGLEGGNWVEAGPSINVLAKTTMTGAKQLTIDLASYGAQLNPALRGFPESRKATTDPQTGLPVFTQRYTQGCVALDITYNVAGVGDVYNGHSFGNFVCVRGHRPGEGAQDAIDTMILGTFVHEIGHGLQQTVKEEQLYDGAGKKVTGPDALDKNYTITGGINQGLWHTNDQGGQGPHCAHNAKLVGGEWAYDSTKGQLCTMYFAGVPQRTNGVFCAACQVRLKRANLSQTNMNKKNWHLY